MKDVDVTDFPGTPVKPWTFVENIAKILAFKIHVFRGEGFGEFKEIFVLLIFVHCYSHLLMLAENTVSQSTSTVHQTPRQDGGHFLASIVSVHSRHTFTSPEVDKYS